MHAKVASEKPAMSWNRIRWSTAAATKVSLLVWLLSIGPGCLSKSKLPEKSATTKAAGKIQFEDATDRLGLVSVYRDGSESKNHSILEGLGGGVAMIDFDGDGWLDLFFPSGGSIEADQQPVGHPSTLWRNLAGAAFENVSRFASIEKADHYSHGVACTDVDHDGFVDILLTGYGGLHFFHNQGDGTYTECADQWGLRDDSWSTSAAWFDLNQDGNLDLFVTHYVDWSWNNNPSCGSPSAPDRCTPYHFRGLTDAVFVANGEGRFSSASGSGWLAEEGKGLGVVAADFSGDAIAEVYVANDTTNNFFYQNSGTGELKENGLFNGTALDERGIPNGSMGIAVADFDLDNRPDLWVTNFENETCAYYQNAGHSDFRCVSNAMGVNALGKVFVGFGTVAGDLDHDGYEDIVVANGHLQEYATLPQEQLILKNEAGRRLVRVAIDEGYFSKKHVGRGLVTGDLNGDGQLDLVFANSMENAAVLLNRTDVESNSWIAIRLIGRRSARDPIGASVVLESGAVGRQRQVIGGGSYLSQGPYTLHWGIPEHSGSPDHEPSLRATVHWPSGVKQVVTDLEAGKINMILEPAL
jgi:enediyne biosynthesis protein E4